MSPRWLLLFAAPPLAVVVASAVLMLLGGVERNPFWPRQQITMAEAAALRDPGTVVRLIESGVDPNGPMAVRPGVLDDRGHHMTPAEAAILADRSEVMAVLVARGARADEERVRSWACLAAAAAKRETLAYLRAVYPQWVTGSCGHVTIP